MEIKKGHLVGFVLGFIVISLSFFLIKTNFFLLMIGMGIIIMVFPFIFSLIRESSLENEKNEMFVEFTRSLVESVKTGIPISKSIINVKDKPFGVLNKNINKLANQIYLGIPLIKALQTFSRDVKSKTVSRAITLIGQAEKSGGDIGEILESVADAVSTSDKLKKERKAVISTLVIQGYIIFFVFIIIILVLQFRLIPMILNVGGIGATSTQAVQEQTINQADVSNAFLYLLLIQGFFSGLTIGKLSEKNIKAGIKHSFILMVSAFLVSSGAKVFLGA
jgi:flagellar protein FlaJ|tara:strand:- start:1260 stop:2093 length:834 start_codon:yes stop_codon:yes gene_type:complete